MAGGVGRGVRGLIRSLAATRQRDARKTVAAYWAKARLSWAGPVGSRAIFLEIFHLLGWLDVPEEGLLRQTQVRHATTISSLRCPTRTGACVSRPCMSGWSLALA